MRADGWRLFHRETTLTDAVLRPPLTGKEVEKGFLNFDPSVFNVTSGLNIVSRKRPSVLFWCSKRVIIGLSSEILTYSV